eukprot:6579761-Pyramimonas_sp.AAC.1
MSLADIIQSEGDRAEPRSPPSPGATKQRFAHSATIRKTDKGPIVERFARNPHCVSGRTPSLSPKGQRHKSITFARIL